MSDVPCLLTFTAQGRPAPQGSKRAMGPGRMIEMSRHVGPWRNAVRAAAQEAARTAGWVPLDCRHEVHVTLYIKRPAKPKRSWPGRGHGDVDKHARAVLDGLTGPVLADDADVDVLHVTKTFAQPGAPGWGSIHVERIP